MKRNVNTILLIFCGFMLLALNAGSAFGHEITVDPGGYSGYWSAESSIRNLGPATVDLGEGPSTITIGYWPTRATFIVTVDGSGFVTVLNGVSGVGGDHTLTFNTIEATVDPNGYDGGYSFSGTEILHGPQTLVFVPGTGEYNIQFGRTGYEATFEIDSSGVVSALSPDAIIGGQNRVIIRTAPVTIDRGEYLGQWAFNSMVNNGGTYHDENMTRILPTGVNLELLIGGDMRRFKILSDGTVTTTDIDAFNAFGNTLQFNTTPIIIDPADYTGKWMLGRALPDWYNNGYLEVQVIPGIQYSWFVANSSDNRTTVNISADGQITGGKPDSYEYVGNKMIFKTATITIDPNGWSENWSLNIATPIEFAPNSNEVETFSLVKDHSYNLWTINQYLTFWIDAQGNIDTGDAEQVFVEGSTLYYNTVEIEFNPGAYLGNWGISGITGGFTGQQSFFMPVGVNYKLYIYSEALAFTILGPCSTSPEILSFTDADIALSCTIPSYDFDGDEIPDETDNCPDISNNDQLDLDQDGSGDVCDDDDDNDTILDVNDNCPALPNVDQADLDHDFVGDACDNDADGDSVPDAEDNCLGIANTDQADSDQDAAGDVCDNDDDNDGIADESDNCPLVVNTDQADFDNDGEGNVCDGDSDADTVINELDACADTPVGLLVSAEGCSGSQYVRYQCSKETYVIHGHYVKCVTHAAIEAVAMGLLSNIEKGRIVREAAK